MPGALLQLNATGVQDVPLTGMPEVTFFKGKITQYTNFAMESIENNFQGQADFGRRVSLIASRSGDMIAGATVQVTLPEINQDLAAYARWMDYIGEHLIATAEIEIGGQKIDKHYSDWIHIWNQLTIPENKRQGYYRNIGHTTQLTYMTDPSFADISGPCSSSGGPTQVCAPRKSLPETTLYIDLMFWFCKNPGLALPLVALQFHDVKFTIEFRSLQECLWAVKSLDGPPGSNQTASSAYQVSLVAASIWIDYIFLGNDERNQMSQNQHEYLIEQLQFTGDEQVGSSATKIRINANHPTKAVYWVVQPTANVDYCSSLIAGKPLFNCLGAQPFNYTDALDVLPNSMHAFSSPGELLGPDNFITNQMFQLPAGGAVSTAATSWPTASTPFAPQTGAGSGNGSTMSDAATFVIADAAFTKHCWGQNPVVTAKLQFNGSDRMVDREGSYYDNYLTTKFHTHTGDTGINMYPFALQPELPSATGTCNFSRIDSAYLQLVLSNAAVGGLATANVRIYLLSFNLLRFIGGLAGVAFARFCLLLLSATYFILTFFYFLQLSSGRQDQGKCRSRNILHKLFYNYHNIKKATILYFFRF